ncbi:unnamed protein product [Adineta steineri]|uniref:K Homology domain-containing protein n=1 Tax=Adineta steineri TaxID=433720 RepID=A0A819DBP9_9BILA|nr:unnamed protein product [Adineta steineri]CAF3832816.1 unnamed protein product [Adineta steineri]
MASNKCFVHSHKNVSKFHAAINQIRRENKFSNEIYQELPKLCCSCNGKNGLKAIDLKILRQMCEDVTTKDESSTTETDEESDTTDAEEKQLKDSLQINNSECLYSPSHIQKDSMDELSKALQTFKVITATDECIVHNSKHRSRFNHAINLIRRGKEFKNYIYHELPKRCCSCGEKTGFHVIDLNVLINICNEIASEKTLQPLEKYFRVFTLPFEPESNVQKRQKRTSRFIGKKGQNLKALKEKYNVHIHVINALSSKILFKKFLNIQHDFEIQRIMYLDELYVLIRGRARLTTDKNLIDEIQQEINEIWNESSETRFIEREFSFNHNRFQFVHLSFASKHSMEERPKIIGQFIGQKGVNLRRLEHQYNIRLHVVNSKSLNENNFQQIIGEKNKNNFYLFITKKHLSIRNQIPIDIIKKEIGNLWENIKRTDNRKSSNKLNLDDGEWHTQRRRK